MTILCSACLCGDNCKYNGKNNYNQKVMDFVQGHRVIKVCPEVLGGLSTPRVPAEIINGRVINKDGVSVDKEFNTGAKIALDIALKEKPDIAILQHRSPSCGSGEIYDGSFTGKTIKGDGVFVQLLKKNNITVITPEEIDSILYKKTKKEGNL